MRMPSAALTLRRGQHQSVEPHHPNITADTHLVMCRFASRHFLRTAHGGVKARYICGHWDRDAQASNSFRASCGAA
jgi:hypothetical protein